MGIKIPKWIYHSKELLLKVQILINNIYTLIKKNFILPPLEHVYIASTGTRLCVSTHTTSPLYVIKTRTKIIMLTVSCASTSFFFLFLIDNKNKENTHTHTHTYIYIYHHHQVTLPERICLALSFHSSLKIIAPGGSSKLPPLSVQCCCR